MTGKVSGQEKKKYVLRVYEMKIDLQMISIISQSTSFSLLDYSDRCSAV